MDHSEVERQSRKLHEILLEVEEIAIVKVEEAGINPTGLASCFLDRSMSLLDANVRWCLKNSDTKGALDYLNIFMMDMGHKMQGIENNIKKMKDSLDGSEKPSAQINAIKFTPDEHR